MKDLRYIPIKRRRAEAIDVRDLPNAQVRMVREFVDFLRRKRLAAPGAPGGAGQIQEWQAVASSGFVQDWDNPHDAIYDQWQDHYGVREG